jgi:glycosyltransferase involved in cell wall biosynthesis
VRHASHLAPKHESLMYFKYKYDSHDFPEQGLSCFVQNLKTPFTVIPNGYDAQVFYPSGKPDENTFITVAAGIGTSNIIPLKGIDLIIAVAPLFPQCSFTLVGVDYSYLKHELPSNIHCMPQQSQQQLLKLYNANQFYLQLSMSEGFPNAVCEAMLCGCIPIVSDVNALPNIAGDAGFILKRRDANLLSSLISDALKCDGEKHAIAARQRIMQNFPLQRREDKLLKLIQSIL